jgi:hypothetical protein
MPRPEASPAAEEIYSALEPAFSQADPDNDFTTLRMCMAIVAGKIDLLWEYLIDDVTNLPAFAILLDPERCPESALPWLSQFSGADLTPEMTEEARRLAIQTPEAFSRGRLKSVEAVAKRRLTGTKAIVVTERYSGSAWRLRIETIEAETPDPEGTEADIIAYQKPLGVLLFLNTRAVWDWGELKAEIATYPTWKSVKEAFPTWFDLRTHKP